MGVAFYGVGEPMEERHGGCEACVEICPPHAFTGRPFREEDPRELRFVAHKYRDYLTELRETMGLNTCSLCLYVCPHGRKRT